MTDQTFDTRAMLRYLVGWFTIRKEEPAKLPRLYFTNEQLFCSAQEAGLVAWVRGLTDRDGAYDLTDAGVQWIRKHLLVVGFAEAKCESCPALVTTRIPDDAGGKPKRPSCIACEVSRQRSLCVLLAAADHAPDDGAGTQLDLL